MLCLQIVMVGVVEAAGVEPNATSNKINSLQRMASNYSHKSLKLLNLYTTTTLKFLNVVNNI